MSVARGFLKLARKYERRMTYMRESMIENRAVHIPQLRGILECLEQALDLTYGEMESWADSMHAVFEVDEFDHWYEKIELIFMKWYVCYRYNKTIQEATIMEEAKKSLSKNCNQLEVMNAFRRL